MNMGLKVEHERTNMAQNVDTEINKNVVIFSNFSIFLWNPFLHPTLSTSLFLYLLFYFLLSIPTALLPFLPLPLLLYLFFPPLLQSFCLLSLLTSSSLLPFSCYLNLWFFTPSFPFLPSLLLHFLIYFFTFSFPFIPLHSFLSSSFTSLCPPLPFLPRLLLLSLRLSFTIT